VSLPDSSNEIKDLALEHQAAVCSMRDEDDARLVGDFVGYHILIHLFDGDVHKWMHGYGRKEVMTNYSRLPVRCLGVLANEGRPELLERIKSMVSRAHPNGLVEEETVATKISSP